MKAIGPTISEELHLQSGMNERTEKTKNYMPPYHHIQIQKMLKNLCN